MARPIKNTPIIEGEDAKQFRKELRDTFLNKISSSEKRTIEEENKRMERSYNIMLSISNGSFH